MSWSISDKELDALVDRLTVDEKVQLLNGRNLWKTALNFRLNIPEILMTDGTHGVRYASQQIEGAQNEHDALAQFLSIVNQQGSDNGDAMAGSARPATCFPNGSAFGCSWDIDLAYSFGAALARECKAFGVHLLLGPGINIRRTPLQGRAYEYYSEDPVLSGDLAAGLIRGLQEQGVGASLKHFACNNSEIERTTMSSDVGERALREIYLKGFERAIAKAQPWTVMSAYNRLNGVQAAEDPWLLTKVLREEWGFDGVVVSDWHGIKDRAASLRAGNDLDMPESAARRTALLTAIDDGQVSIAQIDESCRRVLRLIRKARQGEEQDATFDRAEHHCLARDVAAQSLVLLKNRDGLLPLDSGAGLRVLVLGAGAVRPVIQGSGSATTHPTELDIPLDRLHARAGEGTIIEHLHAEGPDGLTNALAVARQADRVIIFVNSEVTGDGERADRRGLSLAAGQDDLVSAVAAVNPATIIVLAIPDAVEMPWVERVGAIVATFYAGQGMGDAVARALFGEISPSGKLTTTFPKRLQDIPGWLTYPGEAGRHSYSDGIFVGYRGYDERGLEPLFPFGFGLSYTRFAYAKLRLNAAEIGPDDTLTVTFELANIGPRDGAEVVQLYASVPNSRLRRPRRELKAFAKIFLAAGDVREVALSVPGIDLACYDPELQGWRLDEGEIMIEVAASSRDIRLSGAVAARPEAVPPPRFDLDTQPAVLFAWPGVRDALARYLAQQLGIGSHAADSLLDRCADSFLGIYKTVCWYIGDSLAQDDLRLFLERLSHGDESILGADANVATRH